MRHIISLCHGGQSADGEVVLGDVTPAFLPGSTIGYDRLGSEAARPRRITYRKLTR